MAKNQARPAATERVEDVAQMKENIANRKRRKRISEYQLEVQKRRDKEEYEKRMQKLLTTPDTSVWNIIRPLMLKNAKHDPFIEAMSKRDKYGNPIWPDFNLQNDSDRIRQNSLKFRDMTILEAFAQNYPEELKGVTQETAERANDIPADLHLGSIVKLRILDISKGNVVFDSGNYKTQFSTPNNLYRYNKLREFTPKAPVSARVIDIKPDRTVVDLFGPAVEEFILPRTARPWIQNRISGPFTTVQVTNLHLVRGGYMGMAIIPGLSDWLGEAYMIPAFVPGSQIVLNTISDFEQYEGKTVEAFVTSYGPRPGNKGMSLVCSCKSLIRHRGNLRMIQLHKLWCEDGEDWKKQAELTYKGRVTGVINSQKKCGAFVEIPELEITGMVALKPEELVNYSADMEVNVHITGFDEELVWNEAAGQYQHIEPYVIEEGALKEINIKPVLEFA